MPQHRTLIDLQPDELARATGFSDPSIGSRLATMGLIPGSRVELIRSTAFGYTCYVKVDGIRLALRREEAKCVWVAV